MERRRTIRQRVGCQDPYHDQVCPYEYIAAYERAERCTRMYHTAAVVALNSKKVEKENRAVRFDDNLIF